MKLSPSGSESQAGTLISLVAGSEGQGTMARPLSRPNASFPSSERMKFRPLIHRVGGRGVPDPDPKRAYDWLNLLVEVVPRPFLELRRSIRGAAGSVCLLRLRLRQQVFIENSVLLGSGPL